MTAVHRFAKENGIPVVHFAKGDKKEEIARPLLDAAASEGGDGKVVLIGIAQEKASVWRSWPAKGQKNVPHPHMEWGRQMAFVNRFYFYLWDPDWAGRSGRPTPTPPGRSGSGSIRHEWAKRQLEQAGIGYEALDNGSRFCEDPRALQKICDRLGPGALKSFFWRWANRLPSPFTRSDLRAGTPRTGMPFGSLANPPTSVCATLKRPTPSLPRTWSPSTRWPGHQTSMAFTPPDCGSEIRASWPSWRPSWAYPSHRRVHQSPADRPRRHLARRSLHQPPDDL